MWLESGQRTYTIYWNATECISMQCNVVKCNPKQCIALQCDVMKDSACEHCEAMCNAVRWYILQDGAHVNAMSNTHVNATKYNARRCACVYCEAMCNAMQGNIMQDGAHVNALSNPQMVSAKWDLLCKCAADRLAIKLIEFLHTHYPSSSSAHLTIPLQLHYPSIVPSLSPAWI